MFLALKGDFFGKKTTKFTNFLLNLHLKKLDIGDIILDNFRDCENIRDLHYTQIDLYCGTSSKIASRSWQSFIFNILTNIQVPNLCQTSGSQSQPNCSLRLGSIDFRHLKRPVNRLRITTGKLGSAQILTLSCCIVKKENIFKLLT